MIPKKESGDKFTTRITIANSCAVLFLFLFAFSLVYLFGRKGFVLFDFSIIIDGGWRILNGQHPYRDFIIIQTPIVFYLQALFFKLFGANLHSALLHASFFNGLAAGVVFWLLRRQTGFSLAFVCGFITSVWFYFPLSFPWFDTTAFFFVLLAFAIYESTLYHNARCHAAFPLAVGICCAVSFLTKQNIGAITAIVLGLLILQRTRTYGWKRFLYYLGGFLGACGIYGICLLLLNAWPDFLQSSFVRPLLENKIHLRTQIRSFYQALASWPDVLFPLSLIWIVMSGLPNWSRIDISDSFDLLGLLLISAFAALTGTAPRWMFFPFLGIVSGLYISRYVLPATKDPGAHRRAYFTSAGYLVFIFIFGLSIGIGRFTGSYAWPDFDFSYQLKIPEFRPFLMDKKFGPQLDLIVAKARSLIKPDEKVLVFPFDTVIYMALGKVAPQPFLWFHPGFSFSRKLGDEQRLIRAIQEAKVKWLILEKRDQFLDPVRTVNTYLPQLKTFIEQNYLTRDATNYYEIKELKYR
jgi:hypothetical protein